ncbi:hypothetical protein [Anaeromyxobacter sp. Fw109-5]|uniref:hypothetical protein n=1 Tax=Anaeromyxobacter sp. (strain Fw109-5) TaxID=404589 RepID=UPI0002E9D5B3|nr:hypothetical protein [Anaeromyxobacter sp. Fw109-5]
MPDFSGAVSVPPGAPVSPVVPTLRESPVVPTELGGPLGEAEPVPPGVEGPSRLARPGSSGRSSAFAAVLPWRPTSPVRG